MFSQIVWVKWMLYLMLRFVQNKMEFRDLLVNITLKDDFRFIQNIKRLLKIPYSKSQVSMMVHRIGKTLLLDEFDIHQHLLQTAKVLSMN